MRPTRSETVHCGSWLEADWPAPPGVRAGQTLRNGGVSTAPFDTLNLATHVSDNPEAVAANREHLRAALQLVDEPQWLRQVHGVRAVSLPAADPEPEADAAWTTRSGLACAVLTADCLPVLFSAVDGSVVAAAHAGWRGLANGVLESTIAAMATPPAQLQAWLGAAIGPAAFEVGPEVRSSFVGQDATLEAYFERGRDDRWVADLYALARARLRRAGITAVYGGNRCTYSEPDAWFSYRRTPRCGRMASLIWIDAAMSVR
ncbi:MAG: peptidoglycan editing factor PgeF [Pseudomonadota bacterium]|nr:peptidoglycan editing factor PgeF [Pseudomonadota bacterium]